MTRSKLVPALFDRTLWDDSNLTNLLEKSVGVDRQFQRLFEDLMPAVNSAVKYPPYNIRREGEHEVVIEMALAGYGESDLHLSVEDNLLTIRGNKVADINDAQENYIYRGVAAREFERKFIMADGAEVADATLKDGMLYVKVALEEPEVVRKQIPINSGSSAAADEEQPAE